MMFGVHLCRWCLLFWVFVFSLFIKRTQFYKWGPGCKGGGFGGDLVSWRWSPDAVFSTKSLFAKLGERRVLILPSYISKFIWNNMAPPRA